MLLELGRRYKVLLLQQTGFDTNFDGAAGSQASALHALVGFMTALNNTDADGRILVDAKGGHLKFVLLNAAAHFAKVGNSCLRFTAVLCELCCVLS